MMQLPDDRNLRNSEFHKDLNHKSTEAQNVYTSLRGAIATRQSKGCEWDASLALAMTVILEGSK